MFLIFLYFEPKICPKVFLSANGITSSENHKNTHKRFLCIMDRWSIF